jgi:spermidine synthase
VGQLYFFNTIGAVAGTLITGFFLIIWLGLNGAAYAAGALNLGIALAVLMLDKRLPAAGYEQASPVNRSTDSDRGTEIPSHPSYSPGIARLALWAFAISGFCSLAYEVLWTRALVYILDNTAQAFTTMLVAFLLGIALGSLAITRLVDRSRHLLLLFGLCEVLIALFALISIPVFGNLGAGFGVTPDSLWQWAGIRFGRSLLVMLLPTLIMGITFPIASKIYIRSAAGVGEAIGNIYSANTLGGVIGSLAAGFALIPWIGVYHSVMLVAAINTIIGLSLLLAEPAIKLGKRLTGASFSLICFATALAVLLPSGQYIFSSPAEQRYPSQLLYYKEGIGSTVKVYQDVFLDKTISIDGFPVAGTTQRHQDAQRSLGNLPLLLSQAPRPKVNLVGFGAGGASWAATLYNASVIDCVELVPSVAQAAAFFPEINHGVMDSPTFNLIQGDGRNYLLLTDNKYDVITVDATSPKSAGSGSLYTREFYESCQAHLEDGGLVAQWLPFHLLSEDEIKMTARTFMSVFPHASLWFSFERFYFILIGTQSELNLDFSLLEEKMADADIQAELAPAGINDSYDVLSCFIIGEETLVSFCSAGRLNTDSHPYLEYSQTMSYFFAEDFARQNLSSISSLRQIVLPYLALNDLPEVDSASIKANLLERFDITPVVHFWPDYVN